MRLGPAEEAVAVDGEEWVRVVWVLLRRETLTIGEEEEAHARDLNRRWLPADKHNVEFFHLGNLWDQYCEWSAYGAGVPIRLPNGRPVVQYYTPYLSAIQIYTTKALATTRMSLERSDESIRVKPSTSWNEMSKDSGINDDGSWPTRKQIGHLYLQFSDGSPPYDRTPLLEKVCELASSYPRLTSFRSAELSPASWMSVAWYPIYHIPNRGSVKELSACFLTYHTISSSFEDHFSGDSGRDASSEVLTSTARIPREASNRVSLAPFGLATYKMQRSLFANPEAGDLEKLTTLYNAADCWLKQLKFYHDDFHYFRTHS